MSSLGLDNWNNISIAEFRDLSEKYGTPYYLYDADEINRRISLVRESMDNLVKVYYAVKANPNLELLRSIEETADGLDISSGGELKQALLAGFQGRQLSFAGPAKTIEELTDSIRNEVGCISIESSRELNDCITISNQLDINANVSLRINPEFLNRSFSMKMGGKPIQFGIDEEEMDTILDTLTQNADRINFQGIHVYAGSQCFEAMGVLEGVENTLRIVESIEAKSALRCTIINLGGGFGISHGEEIRELDVEELATVLLPMLRSFKESSSFEREFIFELGRYLTANAGIYVTRIISSKTSRGKEYFMSDGGLNHHLSAAGTFGAALR